MASLEALPNGVAESPLSPAEQQMHDDMQWALAHHDALESQYPGESVVVWRRQVIAHGHDEAALLRQAEAADRPRDQLVVVEFPTLADGLP